MTVDSGVPRLRFAPSPVGSPHIGHLHEALFNWALARHMRGDFVLRVDDSGVAFVDARAVEEMMEALSWLGLDWDEGPDVGGDYGPYYQTQRHERHEEVARQLVDAGDAYSGEGALVRLHLPQEGDVVVQDALRGPIRFAVEDLQDPVLTGSHGSPSHHLATVVDDHDMAITHVVRSEAQLSETPILVYLYEVLGWQQPVWVHLADVREQDGVSLSERDPEYDYQVDSLREAGYVPEALFNYLSLLGGAPESAKEIVSKWDVRRQFSIERLSADPVYFEWEKLNRINRHYLQQKSNEELATLIQPYLQDVYGLLDINQLWLEQVTSLIRDDLVRLSDAVPLSAWALSDTFDFSAEAEKVLSADSAHPVLVRMIAELARVVLLDERTAQSILESLERQFKANYGWRSQEVNQPIRAALTGDVEGPALYLIMALLGRDRCLERMAAILRS